jgi:type 1 fimbriae regulatory protein FimB/type 1 fimbriae regulatory protein FimE
MMSISPLAGFTSRRAKGGETAVHPLGGKQLRVLRRLQRESPKSLYLFVSERGAPLSVAGYQRMVARAGRAARTDSGHVAYPA